MNMKKIYTVALVAFFASGTLLAQTTYEEAQKTLKKDKNAIKIARKDAKKWEKQGYINLPGNLPLEKQFERAMVMQLMVDDQGGTRFVAANGSAIAGSEGVAQANAIDNARVALAGQLQAKVTALISNNKANSGFTATELETIDEFISKSKTLIQNEIGPIDPVIEMMRKVEDKFEYRFIVLYDVLVARKLTKEIIEKEMIQSISANEDELNKLLGL